MTKNVITENARPNPYRWYLLALVVSYFTMTFLTRFTWPPIIPIATRELGFSNTEAGAYMSAFFLGYVSTQLLGGILSDRFGSRRVFFLALIIEACGSLSLSYSDTFQMGFFARLLSGLGGGMIFSSCMQAIYAIFPKKDLGIAFGILLTAPAGMGIIVPFILMPYLLDLMPWRETLRCVAVLSCILACSTFLLPVTAGGKRTLKDVAASFLSCIKEKNIVFIGLAGIWLIWTNVTFVTWSGSRINELGFTSIESARVIITFGVGGILGSLLGGSFAMRLPSLKYGYFCMLLALVPALYFFSQANTMELLLIAALLLGLIFGCANSFTPLIVSQYASPLIIGTAGGFTSTFYQVGAVLGPLLAGRIIDLTQNYQSAMTVLSCVPLLGAFFLLFISQSKKA